MYNTGKLARKERGRLRSKKLDYWEALLLVSPILPWQIYGIAGHFVIIYLAPTVVNSICGFFGLNRDCNERLFINLTCNLLTKDWVVYTRTVL